MHADRPTIAYLPKSVLWHDAVRWLREYPVAVRRGIAAVLTASALLAAGVVFSQRSQSGDAARAAQPAVAIDPHRTRVATAELPLIDVYSSPAPGAVTATLEHPTASGAPLVFLVEGEWGRWYRVRLPNPPHGAVGWIRAEAVAVTEHAVRITIDLDDHLLVAYEEGRLAIRAPIAVGARDRPAPGTTFVTDRLTLANRSTGYGRWALPLAGYGNGEETLFRGGGLVAVHGTDRAVEVGQTVPHGSVALTTHDLEALFELAPIGTPVEILAADDPHA